MSPARAAFLACILIAATSAAETAVEARVKMCLATLPSQGGNGIGFGLLMSIQNMLRDDRWPYLSTHRWIRTLSAFARMRSNLSAYSGMRSSELDMSPM